MRKNFSILIIGCLLIGLYPIISSFKGFRSPDHFNRSTLQIIVETTGDPALPFPDGEVINNNTGEVHLGTPTGTDVEMQCQAGDIILITTLGGIQLLDSEVTANDIAAGTKYIYIVPL
jgi:hypothetical protein